MITKQEKALRVDILVEKLKRASGVYVVDYMGMTVAQITEFRGKLREKEIEMQVAKNTIFNRALEALENPFNIEREILNGPSAFIFSYDDPTSAAKVLHEHLKKSELPKLKVASIEGQIFGADKLEAITKLPTREDMIAGIIGSLAAPASGIVRALDQATPLVNILGAVPRDLISVIDQVAQKQNNAA